MKGVRLVPLICFLFVLGSTLAQKKSGGKASSLVNFNQFSRAVTSNGYPAPTHKQFKYFNAYSRSVGKIGNKRELAMALAQLLHESDGLKAKREYACAESNCPNSYRTSGCDQPGKYYFGRGYIQLTWCYNYRTASNAMFGDDRLVRDPDMVARSESVAWRTAFWYWGNVVHNAPEVKQGKFGASTKAINGKLECSAPGNASAQKRFRIYGNVRRAFGLKGKGDPSGCA